MGLQVMPPKRCGSVCRAVVIMAERNKSDMDAEVQAALKGYRIRWQTREGAPYSAADLAKVSASAASTVILMRPDNSRVPFKDSDSAAVRRRRFHQVSLEALSNFIQTFFAWGWQSVSFYMLVTLLCLLKLGSLLAST